MNEEFGFVKEFLDEIKDSSIADFYHDNRYSTWVDDNGYKIKFIIPGANKEDISLKIEGDTLKLSIKGNEEFKPLKDTLWCPPNVNMDGVSSVYKNGILVIKMPFVKSSNRDEVTIDIE